MADITLINASYSYWRHLPLGALSVASAMENSGFEVDFRDCILDLTSLDSFISNLKKSSDVIAIGCSISALPQILFYLRSVKNEFENKTIILGGPGPTSRHREIISNFPFIDIIVQGEAEETSVSVLKNILDGSDWDNLKNIPGVTFIKNGHVHISNTAPYIKDLDSLPFLNYDFIDTNNYYPITYETSRGCIGQCTFCALKGNFRRKSINRIRTELGQLAKRKIDMVSLVDDMFNISPRFMRDACDIMKGLGLKWACGCRATSIDDNILKYMSACGCTHIFFGIESGSNKILKIIRKGYTIQEAKKTVGKALEQIPNVATSFIWGFPFETFEDFLSTVKLSLSLQERGANKVLNILTPIPNTPLYDKYKSKLKYHPYKLTPSYIWPKIFCIPRKHKRALISLIKRNPEVFPCYYTYMASNLERKVDYIKDNKISCGHVIGSLQF